MKNSFSAGNILLLRADESQNNRLYVGQPAEFVEDINAWRFYPKVFNESKIVIFIDYVITEEDAEFSADCIYSNDKPDCHHCVVLLGKELIVCLARNLHFI